MTSKKETIDSQGYVTLLNRAVELDKNGEWQKALINYENALELMINSIKISPNEETKLKLRGRFLEYMKRAESLKQVLERDNNYKPENIEIEDNKTGFDYDSLFGRYLDDRVTQIIIEDPYIRQNHQINNLIKLFELAIRKTKVKKIILYTGTDNNLIREQSQKLNAIKFNLNDFHIDFTFEFVQSLHDRQIKLNNGWVISLGRGLDYFKSPANNFSIGVFDMKFRKCHKTSVNIFHEKSFAK